jgi:monoamine oxidase
LYKFLSEKHPDAFQFEQRVTAIRAKLDGEGEGMEVTINNSEKISFPYVISTIPLPVLRTIDLSGAGLSTMQLSALRQLNYGSSTKIGLQFRTAWWTTKLASPIIGGQTYTDSPLRTIVYPSFGDVANGKTTTLIASYCWTDDVERLGALINRDTETLTRLVLRELTRIHGFKDEQYLRDDLIDMFPWDWSQDIFTMGMSLWLTDHPKQCCLVIISQVLLQISDLGNSTIYTKA